MTTTTASLRRVGVIALAEVRRSGGAFDRRTTLALVLLGLLFAAVYPNVTAGLDLDRGLYRVAVTPSSPLLVALEAAPPFRVILTEDPAALLAAGGADLAIDGLRVSAPDTDKGRAAVTELRRAVDDARFERLLQEADQEAAFPVRVELVYVEQERRPAGGVPGATPARPAPDSEAEDLAGGELSGADVEAAPVAGPSRGFDLIPQERSVATPATLAPPFPFRSLLLAYLFLVPMNFVVQVYAGSAIAERLGRKGEALLASPARPWEIVAGKAAPYFLAMMLAGAGIALSIGAGWLSLLAIAPLALAFLALEFLAAMFARSFRELTFLTVFTSVLLTIYAFLPAVFSDVHPVALVSPITLVVMDLRGEWPGLAAVLYTTLPLTFFAGVSFVLGTALYREEDLFHQKPVPRKALDALARQVRGLRSAVKLPFMLLPAVVVVELLLVTFLFAWPVRSGLLGILVAVALVEETFKAGPSLAAVGTAAVPARRAVLFGALVGVGFFLAEKAFLLVSLAGLMDVPAGSAVFGAAGSGALPGSSGLVALALVLGPLALHVATAGLSAWGAARGRATFLAAFASAILVHVAYNWTVVTMLGGVAP